MGEGDEWPAIREAIVEAEILVIATPTWLARPSSVTQRVLERMDAMIAETTTTGRPVAYGKVAGVVVTGNEDGAHHVISEVRARLIDIGFTVPGQAWTTGTAGRAGQELPRRRRRHDWSRTRRNRRAEPRRRRQGARRGAAPGPDQLTAQPQGASSFVGSVGTKSACVGRWARTSV